MQIKSSLENDLEQYEDYKSRIVGYLRSKEFEVLTPVGVDSVIAKRQEFMNYLRTKNLISLLDPDVVKSSYRWDCALSIYSVLQYFDAIISQHYKEYENELYEAKDLYAKNKIIKFDKSLG